jgi:hypothetical protein
MIDRLIEIGRHYGMEMNVEKTNVTRMSWQPTIHRRDCGRSKTTGECRIPQIFWYYGNK